MEEAVEAIGQAPPDILRSHWEREALERAHNQCVGCGGDHKLKASLILPEEAGGELTVENSTVLCRVCEMARDAVALGSDAAERPVNFWASRRLYNTMKGLMGFSSMSGLVRYLMRMYVGDPKRFDDLSRYQDIKEELKVNVWVDRGVYRQFQEQVRDRGLTVTSAIKSLVLLCEAEQVRA